MGPGKEEYIYSEKYEIKYWDVTRPDSIAGLISRVNQIRKGNSALHSNESVQFYPTGNESVIAYSKSTDDLTNIILTVVNLDPDHIQGGIIELPLDELELDTKQPYQVHDLLTDNRYIWSGPKNYIALDPKVIPAHIFSLRRRVRTEKDFDYYL